MEFIKAHAYGNDFLYVRRSDVGHAPLDALARTLCARHTGIGADGLMIYEPSPGGAAMELLNADGSRSELSGNGIRGLAAILGFGDEADPLVLTIQTEAGRKRLTRTGGNGARQTFRAAMGTPRDLRKVLITAGGESFEIVVMDFGNPQAVVVGPLPDLERFNRLGPAIERHPMFPARTNVEFAQVQATDAVRILIWERGVGPTESSGTGSCASLIAAAAYGGASRHAKVIAPGGVQDVEWADDQVYLTGWAEILCRAEWLGGV